MTPFQRQVWEALKAKEAREQQERMQQGRSGSSSGPTPNSLHGTGGQTKEMKGETVRYEAGEENPDANTSFVD